MPSRFGFSLVTLVFMFVWAIGLGRLSRTFDHGVQDQFVFGPSAQCSGISMTKNSRVLDSAPEGRCIHGEDADFDNKDRTVHTSV